MNVASQPWPDASSVRCPPISRSSSPGGRGNRTAPPITRRSPSRSMAHRIVVGVSSICRDRAMPAVSRPDSGLSTTRPALVPACGMPSTFVTVHQGQALWCTVTSSSGHRGHVRHSCPAIELPEVRPALRSADQGQRFHCLERTFVINQKPPTGVQFSHPFSEPERHTFAPGEPIHRDLFREPDFAPGTELVEEAPFTVIRPVHHRRGGVTRTPMNSSARNRRRAA